MVPGLKRILELIKASPNDERLVDRYLTLAKELSDVERIDATMRLAEALTSKAPRKALDLAWPLFKSGERDGESLSVIASSLEALGKLGRAAALRADTERLLNNPHQAVEKEKLRHNIEQTIALAKDGPSVGFGPKGGTKTTNAPAPIFNLTDGNDETLEPNDRPTSLVAGLPVSLVETPVPKEDAVARNSVARVSAATPGAGIPEAIPPKEPSKHSKALQDRFDRVSTPAVDDVTQHVGAMDISDLMSGDLEKLENHIRELIEAKRFEGILELVEASRAGGLEPRFVEIFKSFSLEKIDIRFAAAWIDMLVDHREERRALRFIHRALIEEPHLAWARMALPRLSSIAERLALRPIQWQEADGVAVLRRQIERMRPRTSVYVVGTVIAS